MRRREFVALLGGVAAWPLQVNAQEHALKLVGFLGANTPSVQSHWTAAFVQRLEELGWLEGRNVVIEYRWAEGRSDRSPEIIAEFIRRKVDVIVTHGTLNVVAAKQATSVIPIVFTAISDPAGNKIVASLARPGGNATGLSNQIPELAGKRIEMLREIIPGLRRMAILANFSSPAGVVEIGLVERAARSVGIEVEAPEIRRGEDIARAIEALKGRAEAIYIQSDPLFNFNKVLTNTLALNARLPTVVGLREFLADGGLISYGPNIPDLFRRAADYVDRILRGANPADIPVEQPTKFDLIINLKTAAALVLTIPPTLLARADEVIE